MMPGRRGRVAGLAGRLSGRRRSVTEADAAQLFDEVAASNGQPTARSDSGPPPAPPRPLPPSGETPATTRLRPAARPAGWYPSLSRRGRVALWMVLLAWAVVGAIGFGRWSGLLGPGSGEGGERPARSDLVLAAVFGPDGPPALALLYGGTAGTATILLPAGTQVEVPGVGSPQSLTRTLDLFGAGVLSIAVANLLGTTPAAPVVVQGPQLAALIDEIGGVEVVVPETLEIVDSGVLRTLFARGAQVMDGATFVRFLTVDITGQNELERVARQNAAWRGLFAAVAKGGHEDAVERHWAEWDTELDPADASAVVAALGNAPGAPVITLPVERTGVTSTDLYMPADERFSPVHAALRGILTAEAGTRLRVRLLVGADGDVGPPVARVLVENGYNIVVTGAASQPYDETRVVIAQNTAELRVAGRELIDLLGAGRLGLLSAEQGVFDVTLVIGRDWARAHGFPQSTDG